MPKALTLECGPVAPRTTRVDLSWEIPWEVAGYAEDAAAAKTGGLFDLSHYRSLSISGPDARDYLQRMSTVNFKTFRGDRAEWGGFLTGKAGVIALGTFLPTVDGFQFVLPPARTEAAKGHLEAFHFLEKLTIADRSEEWALFGLWNLPATLLAEWGIDGTAPPRAIHSLSSAPGQASWWRDDCREALVWVRMIRDQALGWIEGLRARGVPLLGHRLFEYHRIKAGLAEAGREVSDRDILLEASGERFVARDKGCYPGQEVIERIFTYGQVNRRLLPMTGEGAVPSGSAPWRLTIDGIEAALLVAWEIEPGDPTRGVGLAYVKRAHWESDAVWSGPPGWHGRLRR